MTVKRKDIREIELELTGMCNLGCYICSRNFLHSIHTKKVNIRKLDEIIRQLDTFTGLKTFFIAGISSEPTLYPEFFGFLEYLNRRDITYEIYSNGNTHDRHWWETLGGIVPEKCKMVFTVCGSTQELHEKYRVGSNLEQILEHASAFRKNGKKNDYCQHILFEYNQSDYESGNMNGIFRMFSHSFQVHSEGRRLIDEKIKACPEGVRPPVKVNSKIDYIFKDIPKPGQNIGIKCKLDSWKKMYIDQFGNLFPCYTYAEYGLPPFDQQADEFDIGEIEGYKYKTCFLCSKRTNELIEKLGLDFVC